MDAAVKVSCGLRRRPWMPLRPPSPRKLPHRGWSDGQRFWQRDLGKSSTLFPDPRHEARSSSSEDLLLINFTQVALDQHMMLCLSPIR